MISLSISNDRIQKAGTLLSINSSGNAVLSAGNFIFSAAVSKIVPGATSLSLRNNADSSDNIIITDAGAITVRSTISGVTTLTCTTVTATNLGGTLSTAAQSNVTSLGTLTSLTVSGNITLSGTSTKIIQPTTSLLIRDHGDTNTNVTITDAGAITVRSTISGITTLTATTLAGTLSTAAQPNITSLGALTGLNVASGTVTLPAVSVNPAALNMPECIVYNGSAMIGLSGAITFDSEISDASGMHTGSGSRITVPTTGDYECEFIASWNGATATAPSLNIYGFSFLVNGADASPKLVTRQATNSDVPTAMHVLKQRMSLTANDYVEVNAGSPLSEDGFSARAASFRVKRIA